MLAEASSQSSGRVTRRTVARHFKLPKYKLESTKKCFNFAAAKFWNSLPSAITTVEKAMLTILFMLNVLVI